METNKIHKNFLLITDQYPPAFAPRMGYMLKYLSRKGWRATVITRPKSEDKSFQSLVDCIPVPVCINVGKLSFDNRYKAILYHLFYPVFFYYEAFKIYRLTKTKFRNQSFDFVLCCISYHNYMLQGSYWVAKYLKLPLLIDIRDIEEQQKQESTLGLIYRLKIKFIFKRRNNVLKKANCIITITKWHQNFLRAMNDNVKLIYNGYDPDNFFPLYEKKSNKFEIIYTGAIFESRLDGLNMFFESIILLKNLNKINFNELKLIFYVPENSRKFIVNHHFFNTIKDLIQIESYVDTSKLNEILNRASLLLVLLNKEQFNDKMTSGKNFQKSMNVDILTTKYFEYLAVQKPILVCRSDNGAMEESIKVSNSGCAANSALESAEFIIEKYREWLQKGYTTQSVNLSYINNFRRDYQSLEFESIFLNVLND